MKTGKHLLNVLSAASVAMAAMPWAMANPEISSFASVREDSTLEVSGYRIHLYGIYIPPTGQTCHTFIRPVPCGPRASLALEFKLSGEFVQCLPRATNADGSITASCKVGNEDLSEWMLQRGWAVARPDAPFEYSALERIAQARGFGVWGIPIDVIRQKRLK
jgi:endonuclease YncB( thermonuclease family)